MPGVEALVEALVERIVEALVERIVEALVERIVEAPAAEGERFHSHPGR